MKRIQSDNRRKAISTGIKTVALMLMGSFVWSTTISEKAKAKNLLLLRPPGALKEEEFIKSCIRCGLCVEACPYRTLKLADVASGFPLGTPYFIPREIPCYMCEDVPCVPICPTKALDEKTISSIKNDKEVIDINKTKMGVAIVDSEHCIAFEGIRCDVCYRECPLAGEAITIEFRHNERTGKHAMFIPVVNNEICTGCGKCEKVCPTEEASIFVLPPHVFGKLGDHYARGWDEKDQQRIIEQQKGPTQKSDSSKNVKIVQDYLDNEEF